jgi:uncharacterized protein (DUF1800 family)
MVHSPEFWAAASYQAKVKTPLEYVVSAARASGAEIVNVQPLINALNTMGMPLYGCVPPTGYSLMANTWVSTGELVDRMNFALSLATNRFGGIQPQWSVAGSAPGTSPNPQLSAAQSEQDLEARLIPGGISVKTREAVLDQALTQAAQAQNDKPAQKVVTVHLGDMNGVKPDPQVKPGNVAADKAAADAAAKVSAQDKQNAQIAGLLLGSPEFQRR